MAKKVIRVFIDVRKSLRTGQAKGGVTVYFNDDTFIEIAKAGIPSDTLNALIDQYEKASN